MFAQCNGYSPVSQDFIWLGEYTDGTHLSEYDFVTQAENSFYAIQREKLIRFGMVGHGQTFFFESDGIFKLAGRMVELVYSTPDKDYHLTGNVFQSYRDIIAYKDAEASGLPNYSPAAAGEKGVMSSTITQFNFGYKAALLIDQVEFHVKAICKIPFNAPVHMALRLVSNTELNGKLQVKVNGLVTQEFSAPLKHDIGGELNWLVQ
ncbi:hypothetical protein ACFQ5D_02760 [Paenibacillus farraposensis]|uniref:Phage protein n=1 Tax=Paenibacillus farraposensis TaxID=2807095 RepID=A0ABW4D9E0_9BACL|nr:hypothetical protein [Paenibacillus farraposensis]MCC3381813.1 hypothetical protein [Paenibacillus farraposensis]